LRRFSSRGLVRVRTDLALEVLVHNLLLESGLRERPLRKNFCTPLYHYTPRLFEDFFPEKSLTYAIMTSMPLYPRPVHLYTSIPPLSIHSFRYEE
jgi:hypothetical protein